MSLFQNSVLNKYLATQDLAAMQGAYALYTAFFQNPLVRANIRTAKEEQFQPLQSEIISLDREIDALEYELYGLTEEEIGIMEGGVG